MKILLADDHAMMRDGLRAILTEAGLQVVGEAGSGREAVELARRLRPDLVVMDISMPDLNGIDATRQILSAHPGVRVLALSMHSDKRYVASMFRSGAAGYLLKDAAASELIRAVSALGNGQNYTSPAIPSDWVEQGSAPPTPADERLGAPLSAREREVLKLIAEGNSSKDIANSLGIAISTVETHRQRIVGKLGLHSVAELTRYAIREGIALL